MNNNQTSTRSAKITIQSNNKVTINSIPAQTIQQGASTYTIPAVAQQDFVWAGEQPASFREPRGSRRHATLCQRHRNSWQHRPQCCRADAYRPQCNSATSRWAASFSLSHSMLGHNCHPRSVPYRPNCAPADYNTATSIAQ